MRHLGWFSPYTDLIQVIKWTRASPVFAYCKGSPGPFYHLNEVSVYQGKQKGERSSQAFEALSSCFCLKHWSFEHSGSKQISIIHIINGSGLPPSFLHTASDQKLDSRNAWEVAIVYHC